MAGGMVISLDAGKAKADGAEKSDEAMDSGGARKVWAKRLATSLGMDPEKVDADAMTEAVCQLYDLGPAGDMDAEEEETEAAAEGA